MNDSNPLKRALQFDTVGAWLRWEATRPDGKEHWGEVVDELVPHSLLEVPPTAERVFRAARLFRRLLRAIDARATMPRVTAMAAVEYAGCTTPGEVVTSYVEAHADETAETELRAVLDAWPDSELDELDRRRWVRLCGLVASVDESERIATGLPPRN